MAKKYNYSWNAKKISINFNEKQWRQDLAFFIKEKQFWDITKVTRSKAINSNPLDRGIKSFEVYDQCGHSIKVIYKNEREIVSATDLDLIQKYFIERRI